MFISHFNRYFEKHAKITYFVLLLIIIATFVIFVTPGDVMGGPGRITDFGKMYGKTLTVEKMEKEMNRALISIWLDYPQYFGSDVFRDKRELFSYTLTRMRLLHAAKDMKLNKVEDQAVIDMIRGCSAFQSEGKFDNTAYKNFLDYCKNTMGIYPADFDEIAAECISVRRVQDQVRGAVSVTDSDIESALALYTLQCATVDINRAAYQPVDGEIRDFFNNRKAELAKLLPDTKNASIALFSFTALKAAAAKDKALAAAITPTAEEISLHFKANSETIYKGKTLEQVKAAITGELAARKLRTAAREKAGKLVAEMSAQKELAAAQRITFFNDAAKKAGAAISASGLISSENAISGMKGEQISLANAIRGCKEIGDISDVVQGADYTAVVCITEKQPTTPPAALPEGDDAKNNAVYRLISEAIIRERALAFYNEKVKAPFDAYMAKVNAIKEDKSLDENTRNAMMMEAGTGMDSALILPFYIQETRDFALVTFDNEAYAAKITAATEADASAAYESRKVEFQTPQVKSAYIRIQTAGLEGEALQAKLDKAAQAEKRIKAGEDFSKVAQELSDSQVNEDQALYPITVHPEAIAAALKDLKVGAVTGIIDTEGYKHIFKVLERAEGKNFADVKESLIQELNADRMERMAAEDSAAFATKFSDEYWKSTSKADAQVDTAAMMKKLAAEFPMAKFSTASQVSPQDNSSYDQNLLYNVFKATMAAPLTGSISAAGASYNALLLGVTEGRLADPAADSSVYQVTLMPAYTNAVNTEDALLRANAEVKRMRNALTAKPGDLAAAAGNLKFQAMPAFSINDITTNAQNVQEIQKKFSINLNDLVPVLKNVTVAGGVLEPQLASLSLNYGRYSNISLGYQVLYVAERTVPQTEKAKLEEVRAQLLLSKQNEAMADFMQKLELESDTQLRPDTSYTSGLAN